MIILHITLNNQYYAELHIHSGQDNVLRDLLSSALRMQYLRAQSVTIHKEDHGVHDLLLIIRSPDVDLPVIPENEWMDLKARTDRSPSALTAFPCFLFAFFWRPKSGRFGEFRETEGGTNHAEACVKGQCVR